MLRWSVCGDGGPQLCQEETAVWVRVVHHRLRARHEGHETLCFTCSIQLLGRRAFLMKGWRNCPTASTRLAKGSEKRLQSIILLDSSGGSCLSYCTNTHLRLSSHHIVQRCKSKDRRICVEYQGSTWCLLKALVEPRERPDHM